MTKINKIKDYFNSFNVINDNDFDGLTFEEMSNPRFVYNILVDNSVSMQQGEKIFFLNQALSQAISDIAEDEIGKTRIDIKVTQFGDEIVDICDWTPVRSVPRKFDIAATGKSTRLGAATIYGIEGAVSRKNYCKSIGNLPHHLGVNLIITDGEATDSMTEASAKAREYEQKYGIQTWVLAIPGANVKKLGACFDRVIVNKSVDMTEILRWMSQSFMKLSESELGEKIQYDPLPESAGFVIVDSIPEKYF